MCTYYFVFVNFLTEKMIIYIANRGINYKKILFFFKVKSVKSASRLTGVVAYSLCGGEVSHSPDTVLCNLENDKKFFSLILGRSKQNIRTLIIQP